MTDSRHVISNATRSFCPHCQKNVDLLSHETDFNHNPAFYLCWNCRKVFEIGLGPVHDARNCKVIEGEWTTVH